MGLREDIEAWADIVSDPSQGPVTALGQVVDDLYAERKLVANNLLGIQEDDVANTVTYDYSSSGLRAHVEEHIGVRVSASETDISSLEQVDVVHSDALSILENTVW